MSLIEILEANDDDLLRDYGRWYLADRNPMWLRRNALIAVGNVADPADARVAALLAIYLVRSEPILRAHAVWAAAALGLHHLLPATDSDPDVRHELALVHS